MTREEAVIVARIANTADEGCSVCVNRMFDRLRKHLPDLTPVWDREQDGEKGLW